MNATIHAQLIKLNNMGVDQFQCSNFQSAYALFRMALETMELASKGKQEFQSASVGLQWTRNPPRHIDEQTHFVFQRALVIVFNKSNSCSAESTAIIYNLALSAHMKGLITNSSALLEKALQWYQIALSITQRKEEDRKLWGEKLLDMGILNNISQIHCEFFRFDPAQTYSDEMSSRLISLMQSGTMDQDDCEGFIWNLRMGESLTLAPAA